jgi:dipeptidase E
VPYTYTGFAPSSITVPRGYYSRMPLSTYHALRLLLLSNSRDAAGRYLVHARDALAAHLHGVRELLFVPYAGVTVSWDAYAVRVAAALEPLGLVVRSVHDYDDPLAAVRSAEAIAIGGGNTFHLLATLQRFGLVDPIRRRALDGMPYVGWSAGSVVACPTLQTTNDMPIVQPTSFEALKLVDFQINAHFTDAHPPGFQGETRRERLAEYVAANPSMRVIGLPEGDWLRVTGTEVHLEGEHEALVFSEAHEPQGVAPGTDCSRWLRSTNG